MSKTDGKSAKPPEKKRKRTRSTAARTKTAAKAKPAAKPKTSKPASKPKAAASARAPGVRRGNARRPWLKSYPEGIAWDFTPDLTPIHERVRAAAARYPEDIALDFLGSEISFRRMWREIEALSGALQQKLGVKKGTRVALLLPNTPYYVYAYYAVLLAGGTVVNCNPLYTVDELDHLISNAGARVMVTIDLKMVFEKAEKLCGAGRVETLVVCPFAEALPTAKSLLFRLARRGELADPVKSAIANHIVHYRDLVREGLTPRPVKIDPETDIAVQQYTGGTTGTPKGAMLTHANIAANVSQLDLWAGRLYRSPDRIMAVLPFFQIFAMTTCLNLPLANGARVVMLPRFELKALLSAIRRTRANIMPAVPTLTHAIANSKKTRPEDIASLEVLISGGAPLPDETRNAFAKVSGALLGEGYGLTECSPVVCCAPLTGEQKRMSIGLPIPATDIRFADIDNPGTEVPLGERGELQVRGKQVMRGYFENEEATAGAFVDGWFRTGDVGYIDEDGYVFLVDRIRDLIISSGYNVYPRNIEEALYRHPAIDECNVIGVPDDYRGEVPVAFVKLRQGHAATAAELRQFLEQHISKIEMPRDFVFKDELPKTLVGKLSKKELREEYANLKAGDSDQK